MNRIIERIREVWGGHDDFEEGGFEYVAFVIRQDLRDIVAGDRAQAESELADVIINATRALDELGRGNPRDAVLARLNARMDGQTDDIIETYQRRYSAEREQAEAEPITESPFERVIENPNSASSVVVQADEGGLSVTLDPMTFPVRKLDVYAHELDEFVDAVGEAREFVEGADG